MNGIDAHLPALAVIVPLLTAPLAALLRDRTLSWAAATAASAFSFAAAIALAADVRAGGPVSYAVGSWPAPYGIELVVDGFSALVLLIVTGASTAALLAARTSLAGEVAVDRQHLLFAAWLLAVAGLGGIAVAGDAFNIFVFMEISSLATYVLVAAGPGREALTSVFRYLVMGSIGATFYLIGVGLIYMMTGTLNLADMEARIQQAAELRPVLVAGGFITIGLALKAAVFPLHAWLPNAYAYAPHVATAFIAACSTKVALYVLLRFDFVIFQGNLADHATQFRSFVLPLAIVAMLVASGIAIFERNVKRMLAYSSVAQVGYILFGAGLATAAGLTAGIVHMFTHALAKGALFLALAVLAVRGTVLSVDGITGAARRMPLTMAAFVVAGLSLIGIPGTAGFISKWYLVVASMELGVAGAVLAAPLLISSVLAVIYVWRVVEAAYFSPERGTAGAEVSAGAAARHDAPWWMLAVLWTVVAANVWFGFQPDLPLDLARQASDVLLPAPEPHRHPLK